MINLLVEGHESDFEITQLLKVFFPGQIIEIINNIKDYSQKGTLIISSFCEIEGQKYAVTKLYKDNELIKTQKENIETIEIHGNIDRQIRIGLKKSLYNLLIKTCDIEVPWGVLTGIRPVKIVQDFMDKHLSDEDILKSLTEEYRLYEDKANLILNTGKKQRKYIDPVDKDRFSLYISIPFCPTRCFYCSFPVLPLGRYREYIEIYIDTVIKEIKQVSEMMKDKKINTVYIGGGTPTAIPSKQLERIIEAVYENFSKDDIKEFTVEAGRPDTIDFKYLTMLNKNGIQRISINPQTMNDSTLKLVGRNHTKDDIIKTYHMAKDIGFDVINMDLIVGLPEEDVDSIRYTLEEIEKLDPENLTVHTLSIKNGSKFKDELNNMHFQQQSNIDAMLKETISYSKKMSLEPYYLYRQKQILGNYENIGYAKINKECIYNIAMMEEKETIIAVGMGAVSKIFFPEGHKIERVPNFKDIKEYINRSEELIIKKKKILEKI